MPRLVYHSSWALLPLITSFLEGSSGFRVGKGVLGLHQAPPQASMIPLCVTLNCTKSS